MSFTTILAAIKAAIEAADPDATVTDYDPDVERKEDFNPFFGDGTIINAWTIVRESYSDEQKDGGFRFVATHDFIVKGYHSLATDGSTAKAFQVRIDAVEDALRGSTSVWALQPEDSAAPQAERIGESKLGSMTVASCSMRLRVQEVTILTE